MVKKGTKRKTRWRTLSIGDGGTDTSDTGITETKQERNETLTSTSNTNLSTYNRKSSTHTTPFHQRNGDRNHYHRNSDKYPSQPHTRTQIHEENSQQNNSSFSYKRRPFYPTATSRYYGNSNNKTNSSTNNRSYRTADTFDNKENNTTKPLFNEDDYTRITTPRQDVLFKKGYLSRPKKTTDTTVSSSTTVSVLSTEDSISSGTQSLSPEHCSSTPEVFDLDHPMMYPGFYDQNGVFFVNPFMSNGFDPYDGQMIMMPYGGSPFSINPTEYCSHESTPPYPPNHYQKRNSVDSENSPESPSSHNESASASASSTPAIDESSKEPSQNGDAPNESQCESDGPKMEGELTPNECNYNMPMQFYYPLMYGPPPFMPINEMDYNDNMAQSMNNYGVKYNRLRKRKRRPYKWGNSTGVSATTTDYSEDDDSIEENNCAVDESTQQDNTKPALTVAQCDDVISRTTLNTNVSEFVPRHLQSSPIRTTLNVEVEEFHPRNYTPTLQSKSTDDMDSSSKPTVTKQISPEPQKVTILHRTPAEKKHTQPSGKTNKQKPEQINVQVSSAIDKSSTLISSISSRDKNDDNVNGVDNNKKIEKLVDPVNIKADLDVKVVMLPKQEENILENVKKTKLKNMKSSKPSPRKMHNGHKIGKGAVKNGKSENVSVQEGKQPFEAKQNDTEHHKEVGERVEKPNQPTYAQMVGPVAKPKVTNAKPAVTSPVLEMIDPPLSTEELKMLENIVEVKPEVKAETKWQTVRPKGKKKLHAVMSEESNDFWNEVDDEKYTVVKETPEPISPIVQFEDENVATDEPSIEPMPMSKVKTPKTDKAKLKIKAKKSQKKIKEKNVKPSSVTVESENTETNDTTDDKIKSKSATPIVDYLFVDEGHEFLNDIDISNFSFETNPSMFVNAITNRGIYTDNSMTGESNAGFTLNNSLKLFDFCKTKENDLLKEEEDMVIRVLMSLNQTENQIVKNDVSQCIVDDVKLKENVKIESNIFEVVNGNNDTNEDANGAKEFVKCKMNENDKMNEDDKMNEHDKMNEDDKMNEGGKMNKDAQENETNGHQIEDSELETDDRNEAQTNTKTERISNGYHKESNRNINGNADEIVVSAHLLPCELAVSIDNKNDLHVTNVSDKNETEQNDEEMTERELVDVEDINKDCTSTDETQSDLSELSDENDETIVSRSNDCFEYDEMETMKDIDVAELIDDLQCDDDTDDFVFGGDEEMNVRADGNEPNLQEEVKEEVINQEISTKIQQAPSTKNIFIESEMDILPTETELNDLHGNKGQDRIQSPRNSEDSGILEYHDDGRYFSESDNDKPEPMSIKSFPLTQAVSRWLEEKQKEKSPEPIIRLPDDPELSQQIEKSIRNRLHISHVFDDYEDDETSDESDTEFEVINSSKNLLSNPLRVLFPKKDTATSNQSNDVVNSNGIRKRVANHKLDSGKSSVTVDEPDILEYWENDPMLQSQNANVLNIDQQNCSIESDLEAYESVYGTTIDYTKLSANIHNDNVFLSNIIVNNDKLSNLPINQVNNNADSSLLHAGSIDGKDDMNSKNKNLNCFKPPEICCMLM